MPIYEYKCRVCDEHFEVEQSFTDEALTEIDGCSVDQSGRHQVKKVFVAPAISFKGDGFYRNDARASTGAKSSPSSDGSSDKASDTSTDSAASSESSTGKSSDSSTSTSSNGDKATTSSSSSSAD